MKAALQLARIRENLKAMEPSFNIHVQVDGQPISINRDLCVYIRPNKKDVTQTDFVLTTGEIIIIDEPFEDLFGTIEDPDT